MINAFKTAARTITPLSWLSLLAMVLAACVIPGASTPVPESTLEPEPVNPAYTAAAQTIIAQLTALAPSTTPLPTDASDPSATGTEASASQPTSELSATETIASPETPAIEPSPAVEPTPTPEPSPTQEPSPTPASNDPRSRLGEPDWRDTFSNANNWPLFEDEHVHFRLKDGSLQLLAKKPEKWDGWMLSWTSLENFYLEVSASPWNCSGADRYGLLGRAPNADAAYLFGFTCDGQYSLRKWNGERFSYLVDWKASDWINNGAGQNNRLGLMANGSQISLYANGELLEEIKDPSYDRGAFGVFISSANTENMEVVVSEVAYWQLP